MGILGKLKNSTILKELTIWKQRKRLATGLLGLAKLIGSKTGDIRRNYFPLVVGSGVEIGVLKLSFVWGSEAKYENIRRIKAGW